jgi:pimeloyl-ACP methyl ester carboxylesterase
MFNFRGHGRSQTKQTTVGGREGRDIVVANQVVEKKFPDRSERLFYYGHSMGASAAMMVPKMVGGLWPEETKAWVDRVDGLILDSPFASVNHDRVVFKKIVEDMGLSADGRTANLLWKHLQPTIERLKLEFQKRLKTDHPLTDYRPLDHMALSDELMRKPILHIHGTEDRTTRFDHAETIRDILAPENPHYEFLALPGEEHLTNFWRPFPEMRFPSAFVDVAIPGGDELDLNLVEGNSVPVVYASTLRGEPVFMERFLAFLDRAVQDHSYQGFQ